MKSYCIVARGDGLVTNFLLTRVLAIFLLFLKIVMFQIF